MSDPSYQITLTDSAKQHLSACLAKHEHAIGIRLSVKKTGCSGLAYVIDYVAAVQPDDACVTDLTTHPIFIDKKSYPFLKNMVIDYIREGFGSKLIFKNPNQTGQCGCGESFTVA